MAVFTPISRRAAVAVVAALLVAGATPCLAGTTLVDPYGRPAATADGQGGSVDYTRPGRVRRVARGHLESVSPDGRAVIVAEVAAASGQPWTGRCDDLFFSQLFVASLDGGKRRPLRLDGRARQPQGTGQDGRRAARPPRDRTIARVHVHSLNGRIPASFAAWHLEFASVTPRALRVERVIGAAFLAVLRTY